MASVTLFAPAKLNLTLEVLNREQDGLHALRSVMVPVDLADEIYVTPGLANVVFTCDDPDLRSDNLVEQAYRALQIPGGASIELRKRIPIEAGMGGGSSDAAAILLAAQRGELGSLPQTDYLAVARALGSDVPFFLVETAALVEGTGERVTALGRVPPWHAVIVKPPVAISTAAAYRMLDERKPTTRPRNASASLALAEALQRAEFDRVVELLHNDFLDVLASTPEIARALEMLGDAGARKPMLTGSGSCVFALARDAGEREELERRLRTSPEYRIFGCSFWSGESWT